MTKKGSWLKAFAWLILALVIYVNIGAFEQWLNPIPNTEFDALADTSEWEMYQVPHTDISLKLPSGATIYTRESLAKGNVNNDKNFEWAVNTFSSEIKHFVAAHKDSEMVLSISSYQSHAPFFLDDYSKYSAKQLSRSVEYNKEDLVNSFWIKPNGHIFICHVENNPSRTYISYKYHAIIDKTVYYVFFTYPYDAADITHEQMSIQNAILKSVVFI